jgi:hypothetical protein
MSTSAGIRAGHLEDHVPYPIKWRRSLGRFHLLDDPRDLRGSEGRAIHLHLRWCWGGHPDWFDKALGTRLVDSAEEVMGRLCIKIRCDIARWSIVKQFPRVPCKLLVTVTPHLPDIPCNRSTIGSLQLTVTADQGEKLL